MLCNEVVITEIQKSVIEEIRLCDYFRAPTQNEYLLIYIDLERENARKARKSVSKEIQKIVNKGTSKATLEPHMLIFLCFG